jgi:hypothetical protein
MRRVSFGSRVVSAVVGGGVAGCVVGAIVGGIREKAWGFFIIVLLLTAGGIAFSINISQPVERTEWESTPKIVTATVTANSLNLRSAPNARSKVLNKLGRGATLTVTGEVVNGWVAVTYNGKQGYVDAKHISIRRQ